MMSRRRRLRSFPHRIMSKWELEYEKAFAQWQRECTSDHEYIIQPVAGKCYIVRPPPGSPQCFWVGQCVHIREEMLVPSEQMYRMGCRINYYEMAHEPRAGNLQAELDATRVPNDTRRKPPYALTLQLLHTIPCPCF